MRTSIALALLFLLAACAPPVVPDSPAACAVERITSVPLFPPGPPATTRRSVAMALDGKPATMMLDSGATGPVISSEAAERLGLRLRPDMRASASGLGGTVYRRVFQVDSVTIGGQTTTDTALAIEMTATQAAGRGFDGIVGMEAFARNDIEIDVPARTMSEVAMPIWRHRFAAADVAGTRFERPDFWILDLGDATDILVGLDILSRMRLWISNGSDAVYIAQLAGSPPGR